MRKAHFWPRMASRVKLTRPPFVGGTIEAHLRLPTATTKVEAEQWRMGITW